MARVVITIGVVGMFGLAAPAAAQEQLLFPWTDNVKNEIIRKLRTETVRIDISAWYLTEREITRVILERFNAGVPVRILGDRVSIFEIDPFTRREFEYLATNLDGARGEGVPIRLRYNPTSFPQIMHWKCGIFVGQNVVEFGSANWTPFELYAESATNYKDETALFTDDLALVNAFKTKFDQYWADTTSFMDWPAAYKRETGLTWATPMTIDRTRLELDHPSPPSMIWEQGTVLNNALAAEIERETAQVDIVMYRLSVPSITNALINRLSAGVPVRVMVEPNEYRKTTWPEFWLTGARIDQLWVAGAQIKQRLHAGLTHMKVLITSQTAMLGSSNFSKNWQRDHNYFMAPAEKPLLYTALRGEFDRMWADTTNYGAFAPLPPHTPKLKAPADALAGVSTTPKLEWNRTPFAVAYDVFLGTTATNMQFQARVNAQLIEDPPLTYSWTPSIPLQTGTTYHWKIVGRTFATDVNPSLVTASVRRRFTTSGSGGTEPTPFGGTPASLPGIIQVENFDEGGSGIAYVDTTAGNAGGQYRTTDVDIETTLDTGGGFDVGWTAAGEWLMYTVNVTAAGTYDIGVRVAASGAGGTFHIEANGVDITGPLTIPNTGGWQKWTTVTKAGVSLNAGKQLWRLVVDAAGSVVGNLNSITVAMQGPPPESTPWGGTPVALPGVIQAENFDEGGPNVAYFDTTPGNSGGKYRTTDVDIEPTSDTGGGHNVGWIAVSEWLKYTVNVAAAGSYDINVRVAASGAGGTFHIEVNGADATGPLSIPNTGGWQKWTTVKKTGMNLGAGRQVWRLVFDSAGSVVGNLNYIRVTASGAPPDESTPFGGTPLPLPGTIQAENFDDGGQTVAYVDTTSGNSGGNYRATDVDIETTSDAGGGYNVGWMKPGEWLNYTVDVGAAGTYNLEVRVAARDTGATFHIEVDGVDRTGPLAIPNTGGYQIWRTIGKTGVSLAAGRQVWRIVIDRAGPSGVVGNINLIRVASAGGTD